MSERRVRGAPSDRVKCDRPAPPGNAAWQLGGRRL